MFRFSRAVVAIAVAIAFLAACSSSDKPRVASNKRLTKAAYIKASDAICDRYSEQINGVVRSAGSGLTLAEAKDTFTSRLIPLFQAEYKELVLLRAPEADAFILRASLTAMNSGISTIIGRVDSATSIADLNAIKPTGLTAWKQEAKKYGMQKCGT